MAPIRELRKESRSGCRLPLECSVPQLERPFEATVYNISDRGIYLETDQDLKPGDSISVRFSGELPGGVKGVHPGEGAGVIRWTRSMARDRHVIFGAGVRFSSTAEEHIAVQSAGDTAYDCDVCGRAMASAALASRSEAFLMCPGCSRNVEGLSSTLYRMASRYLMGNVL